MIGRVLSHYRITDRLGSGGMGEVYRAEDTLLGRPVAIKVPHRHLLDDAVARERFLREARIASVLDHPNIVVVYDVGETDGEIWIAMQCLEGRSLRERMRAGAVPLDEALAVGRAIADALAHAHARGVVHRDVKPENVVLCADGRVKVADFGTARIAGADALTTSSAALGTPAYMAPETLQGAAADARADLYALGVLLHEMVAGAPPFAADTPAALMYRILNEEPAEMPAATPAGVRSLVRTLMAKRPEQRTSTAVELADALKRLAEGDTSAPPRLASGGPPPRSIAVLPFANLTGAAEDDYFCDGITEDLLTDVLRIPDLNVASRTMTASVAAKKLDPREIGRVLGVGAVVEGGVRRAGGRVRVNARLVRTDTGYQMWAERYDRSLDDILEVQEDLSRRIAAALNIALGAGDADARQGRRARDQRAYDLRFQALALFRRMEESSCRRAIELLEQAVRIDPEYALGRADLAECYIQLICKSWDTDLAWLDRGEAEARRALELAPSLAEGYRSLGHLWMHRGRPRTAVRDFQRAIELDPRHEDVLLKLGSAYMFLGDPGRAEVFARRGIEIAPDFPRLHQLLGEILLRQRRIGEARAAWRRSLDLGAEGFIILMAYTGLLLTHLWENDVPGAESIVAEAGRVIGEDEAHVRVFRIQLAALKGDRAAALAILDDDDMRHRSHYELQISVARAHVMLGDREAALEAFDRASNIVDYDELLTDPYLKTLAGDPRFDRVVARIDA